MIADNLLLKRKFTKFKQILEISRSFLNGSRLHFEDTNET